MKLTSVMKASVLAAFASAAPALAEDAVKIGVITTLSGPAGYLGQDVRDGLQLAIDMEGGKLGGVPVELVVEDDGLKPGNGRQIADKFMNDEGMTLLTGIIFSNVAGATVPEIVDNGAIYISPNAGPSNLAGKGCHENYFVVSWQNDALHEAAGAAAKKLGYTNAMALAPNYQAGKDAIEGFKRTFEGEVSEIYTQLGQTDYSAEMAQIRSVDPEVVFQFHPGGMGIAFLRQYQQAGLLGNIPMVLSEPSTDAVVLNAVGDAAIGITATAHWNYDFDNESNKAFVAAWNETYDRPITYYASQGYDTGLLIASALRETGGVDDIDALREAIRKADFDSVRGEFAFGPNQHPVHNWYQLDIVAGDDGKPVAVTKEVLLENYGDAYAAQCEM
ncbi:ABC transporter substrate-binding protein [Lutimaribacter sp. EGI FJ00015]|uniref:ABC transporter substrate-binding protein n=1 Tax=Lutimaribacter degradans TaxID=2945989 RepID=A0ACC5ZXQ9_9RHOB|nr:ABC transporter substrate-binding protein [Lutimaribacter sp. EGI FJ00013]MCM2563153.1 ABC transporter substrate-binding protein [Lutimaribacter sp. EGI FJ00013]MCO0614332.1 ABC transporter substrate-binding protein [Lutimaribacter sp. EGI FJ00015]MCO0637142.1 ABC transporter substrate-binding protein [Lutimaribacter sp. EGI FJ00014]